MGPLKIILEGPIKIGIVQVIIGDRVIMYANYWSWHQNNIFTNVYFINISIFCALYFETLNITIY